MIKDRGWQKAGFAAKAEIDKIKKLARHWGRWMEARVGSDKKKLAALEKILA